MKTSKTRLILLVLTSALFATLGTSCRTAQGFGNDVQHAGGHIKKAASN